MGIFQTRSKLRHEIEERTAELEETRDLINQITDTIPDVLYIINLSSGKITYVSKAALETFGYKPEDIYDMGKSVFEKLVHPEDLQQRLTNLSNMVSLKDREVRESQFRFRAANGEWRWVNNRNTVFSFDEEDMPRLVLGILQDITEKKNLQDAILEEEKRIGELTRANDVLDTFVYAAAHDLKTPIANLILLNEIIDKTDDAETKLRLLKRYKPITNSLDKTLSALLEVLKIEKGDPGCIRALDYGNVLGQIINEHRKEIDSIKPEIHHDFSECPEIIYVEAYLYSIFRNLISNSLKYRDKSRKLVMRITSETIENFSVLTFEDNGIGIDLARCGKDLFHPFSRFNSQCEGSGIGLHLVKSLVTKNGGSIEVESEPRSGTKFILYLVPY